MKKGGTGCICPESTILKALMNGADLLILDEPTSVLTSQESRDLFQNSVEQAHR